MNKSFITSAIAGAFLLGSAVAAIAATGEFNNMCAEGLALHKVIKTDCSVNGQYDGKTYCFGNEQAKTTAGNRNVGTDQRPESRGTCCS